MGFTTTPVLGLIKPDTNEVIKNENWANQHQNNMDIIDGLRPQLDIAKNAWTYIAHKDEGAGDSFDIDITVGGKFPAGTFSKIRLYLRYDLSVAGELVSLRLNDNTTTDHETIRKLWDASTAALTNVHNTGLSRFVVGYGGTVSTNNAVVLLSRIDTGIDVTHQTTCCRQSDSATSHFFVKMWGIKRASIGAINKLTLSVDGIETFTGLIWWAEGYRP